MASEIRVDKINSLSGVGTVTLSPTGVDIAGITTAATLRATTGIVTSLTAGSLTSLGAVSGTTGTFTSTVKSGTTATGIIFSAGDSGNSGDRVIQFKRAATTNDINIQAINSGTGATNLLFNNEGGAASFGGNVSIGDNDELRIGDGSDLKLKHDTNNSIVTNATGELLIDSSIINLRDTSNNSRLRVEPAGNVNVASNLKVAGVCTATSFSGSGANLTGIVAIPSGAIILWSGAANAIPSGFVLCDGNNSTPNLSGKFVVGYDASNGDYDVGDTGGAETVTLTVAQIPSHKHDTNIDGQHVIPGGGGSSYPYGGAGTYASRLFSMSNTGGGGAHENRPPFYALCYIMKT